MVWLAFGLLWFGPVNFCLIKCVTKTRQIHLHYHLHHPRNCQMESEFWNVQPSMGHFCPNMVTPRGSLRLAIILYILHYADANCDINSFMSWYFHTLTRMKQFMSKKCTKVNWWDSQNTNARLSKYSKLLNKISQNNA